MNIGRQCNALIDEIDGLNKTAYGELRAIRQQVFATLPNVSPIIDKWVFRRAIFLAANQSAQYYVGGAAIGYLAAPFISDLFHSVSFFELPGRLTSAAGTGTLAALGAFWLIRRAKVAELAAALDGGKIQRWSEFYRYWDPDDESCFEVRIEADDERNPEPHAKHADTIVGSSWNEVLGVQQTASIEEITAAWKTRLKEYHPDRVATLGPRLRELAEEETKALNAAYETAVQLKKVPQE